MKGVAEISTKLLLFLENVKEAINRFSLTAYLMICFYEKKEQIKYRSAFILVSCLIELHEFDRMD